MSNNNILGKLGEDLACRFLEERGFKVLERNYWKKWGEIDIVAQGKSLFGKKEPVVHFVEVKAVAREINEDGVIRETKHGFQPEDAIHPWKIKRLKRAIQSYLLEKNLQDSSWQFDIVAVFVDQDKKITKIRYTENAVI